MISLGASPRIHVYGLPHNTSFCGSANHMRYRYTHLPHCEILRLKRKMVQKKKNPSMHGSSVQHQKGSLANQTHTLAGSQVPSTWITDVAAPGDPRTLGKASGASPSVSLSLPYLTQENLLHSRANVQGSTRGQIAAAQKTHVQSQGDAPSLPLWYFQVHHGPLKSSSRKFHWS